MKDAVLLARVPFPPPLLSNEVSCSSRLRGESPVFSKLRRFELLPTADRSDSEFFRVRDVTAGKVDGYRSRQAPLCPNPFT